MAKQLPTEPGRYFWTEWQRWVDVTRRGSRLYVRVYPHWQPVEVTKRLAGELLPAPPALQAVPQ